MERALLGLFLIFVGFTLTFIVGGAGSYIYFGVNGGFIFLKVMLSLTTLGLFLFAISSRLYKALFFAFIFLIATLMSFFGFIVLKYLSFIARRPLPLGKR
jgi:hypothetical protein